MSYKIWEYFTEEQREAACRAGYAARAEAAGAPRTDDGECPLAVALGQGFEPSGYTVASQLLERGIIKKANFRHVYYWAYQFISAWDKGDLLTRLHKAIGCKHENHQQV